MSNEQKLPTYELTIKVRVRDHSAGDAAIGLTDLFREQRQDWIMDDPEIISVELFKA